MATTCRVLQESLGPQGKSGVSQQVLILSHYCHRKRVSARNRDPIVLLLGRETGKTHHPFEPICKARLYKVALIEACTAQRIQLRNTKVDLNRLKTHALPICQRSQFPALSSIPSFCRQTVEQETLFWLTKKCICRS